MKVAILGWGSLLWEREELNVSGDWLGTGPQLPIEFTRSSKKRANALTLVVDDTHGELQRVKWILSAFQTVEEARADLQARERAVKLADIAFVETNRDSGHPHAARVREWMKAMTLDGVTWTALGRKFSGDFTIEAAERHLENLGPEGKKAGRDYMRRASGHGVTTPLLRHLLASGWLIAER